VIRQEKYSDTNPVVSFVIGRFFQRLHGVIAEMNPRSVLDAGCGEGEMLRRGVLPAAVRPVCLDFRAAPLAEITGPSRVRGSVLALPFAARSFDMVTCLEVLEHLEHPAAAVRELASVARHAVILSVPHEPYFRIGNVLRGKHLSRLGNHPEHVQHWNFRTFGAFLEGSLAEVRIVEAFPWIIACCRPNQR
jgi:SAM-dependent methyltransferase